MRFLGWFRRKKKASPLTRPAKTLEELRMELRIVVLDDDKPFYLEELRNHGYTVEHYSDVENLLVFQGLNFNVMLLDIGGIGERFSAKQGWGVLEYLRDNRPDLYIILYTGNSWDVNEHFAYIQLADEQLAKTADFFSMKRKIDVGLLKYYERDRLVGRFKYALKRNGVPDDEIASLINDYGHRLDVDGRKSDPVLGATINATAKAFELATTFLKLIDKLQP